MYSQVFRRQLTGYQQAFSAGDSERLTSMP